MIPCCGRRLQLHFCAAYNKDPAGVLMLMLLLLMMLLLLLMLLMSTTGLRSLSHVHSTVSPLQRE